MKHLTLMQLIEDGDVIDDGKVYRMPSLGEKDILGLRGEETAVETFLEHNV